MEYRLKEGEIYWKVGRAALTPDFTARLPGPPEKSVTISRTHDQGDHVGTKLKNACGNQSR